MAGADVRRVLAGAVAAVVLPALGVGLYLGSAQHRLHDPTHSLQQLDLLYLDQPAPGVRATGEPQLLVFCDDACPLPDVEGADVRRVDDPGLAAQYGLGAPGRRGYALVDAAGQVRYRTYDPGLARHEREIQTLVDGLPS